MSNTKEFIQETEDQWLEKHKDHAYELWTPDYPYEDSSYYCHDCKDSAEFKNNKKIDRGE